jgi:hypothetical protein
VATATLHLVTTLYLIDVAVIHPLGPTHLKHKDPIKHKERQKTDKYATLTADRGAVFVPFIVTTLGGIGGQAQEFIDTLSAYARSSSAAASHKDIIHGLQYGISVKIQQGNEEIVRAAHRQMVEVRRQNDI